MKRILILLLICCVFVLSGCVGERRITISEHDPIIIANNSLQNNTDNNSQENTQIETPIEQITGIQIEDSQLAENLKLVCKQIGINSDKIVNMEPAGSWSGGPAYSFTYKDLALVMQGNTDATVESIYVNGVAPVFDKRVGAYHIDEYFVDESVLYEVKAVAENAIRNNFDIADKTEFSFSGWSIERFGSVYSVVGSLMLSEEAQTTLISIEVSADVKQPTLRYLMVGETVIFDELSLVKGPKLKEVVEQSAKTLYSGSSGFLLSDAKVGKYGEFVQGGQGQSYIKYNVPVGKYMVTSKTPLCVIWITKHDGIVSENILFDDKITKMIEVPTIDESKEIVISEGEYIILSYGATAIFEPIQ